MKRKFVWGIGLAILMALAMWGCEDDEQYPLIPPRPYAGLVQIFLPNDTLEFLPGDSALVLGWVVVTDYDGNVLPNVKVDLSLTQPIGYIEYLDPERRDTTDALGKVNFRYVVYGFTGRDTLRAQVGNVVDLFPFVVIGPEAVQIPLFRIFADHDTCRPAEGEEDSVLITAWCRSTHLPPGPIGVLRSFGHRGTNDAKPAS